VDTVGGRAAADHFRLEDRAARLAGLSLAAVDLELDRKVAKVPIWRGEIPDRGPTLLDGFGEHVADFSCKTLKPL